MSSHFGKGFLIGGIAGVMAAMNWHDIISRCPAYRRVEDMVIGSMGYNDNPYQRDECGCMDRRKMRRHKRQHSDDERLF